MALEFGIELASNRRADKMMVSAFLFSREEHSMHARWK